MPLPGRQLTPASGNYRYGFNGKELDNNGTGMGGGGNTYDYGFRIYNPQIAKFLSVDPLTKDYAELSTYQFASNTPIWALDIDGLEAGYTVSYRVYVDKKGDFQTEQLHRPILTETKGDWEGIKVESQFFYSGEFMGNCACNIPGYKEWSSKQMKKSQAYIIGAAKVTLGILAVAAAIPTGGGSLTTLGALGTSFSVVSGSYAVGTGLAAIKLNSQEKFDIADKIPSGYLNATLGVLVKSVVDDQEVEQYFEIGFNIVEGAATMSFKDPTQLQQFSNLVSAANASLEIVEVIEKVSADIEEENPSESDK